MTSNNLNDNPQFQKLVQLVQTEFEKLAEQQELNRPEIESQIEQLEKKISGWMDSLSNPDLGREIRRKLESQFEQAQKRIKELEESLSQQEQGQQALAAIVEPEQVIARLDRLDKVLNFNNPSLGNIEIAQHVDQITCFPDGKTVLRTCRLGPLPGGVSLFASQEKREQRIEELRAEGKATPCKRLKRDLRHLAEDENEMDELNHWATDPFRFAGLDDVWFEEQEFYPPDKVYPYQELAPAVAEKRKEGLTHAKLAEHFGVTTPTIRKALKHAAKTDLSLNNLPRKVPERRWHEDHAQEVYAMHQAGKTTKELAEKFGYCTTTILKAIRYAKAQHKDSAA